MQSLSVKTKIYTTLAILTLGMLVVGLMGYTNTARESHAMNLMFDNYFQATGMLSRINSIQTNMNSQTIVAAVARSDNATRQMHQSIQELRSAINAEIVSYEKTIVTAEERTLFNDFSIKRDRLLEETNKVVSLVDNKQYDEALVKFRNDVYPLQTSLNEANAALIKFNIETGQTLGRDAQKSASSMNNMALILILAACIVTFIMGRWLVNNILSGLKRALAIAENIAGGQLDNKVDFHTQDEFGRLQQAMLSMDSKLSEIVAQVAAGANAVSAAAQQLAVGNDDLSSRTQEQASALEQTASSMEQMTATVKQTADNARQASQLAMAARTQANESGSVVSAAVNAMNEINQSSRRIADIISVIDEIAFQTNLLALNAAVEAARAGEQGRGFAVVASEVRNLAQRSATAAKEIKGLINDSVQKVADGTALVDRSGETLSDIVDDIKKLSDIVAEISAASQEQAAGIDQVNNAVTQLDQTTQQNAALVEEATAASKTMEHHAETLVQQVSFFKTTRSTGAPQQHTARASKSASNPRSAPVSTHAELPMARASGDGSW